LLFSFGSAFLGLVLGALIFCFTNLYVPLEKLHERNQGTLERIQCEPQICDVSAIANDWEFIASDYVVDKDTNFLLNLDVPEGDFSDFVLQRSDPALSAGSRMPASVSTPAGESWRRIAATNRGNLAAPE
jgi:hypothetical protein